MVKSQSQLLSHAEEDKDRLRARITELEASNAKLEFEKRHIKAQEKKKFIELYQAQFKTQLANDRERTKDGTIWRTMNAVLTAYPDVEFSKIQPFPDPQTPIVPCNPTLRAQFIAQSGQGWFRPLWH